MTVACSLLLHCTRKYCGTGICRRVPLNRVDSISFQLFLFFKYTYFFCSSSTKRLFSNIFQFRSGHFFYCSPFICFTFFRFFFCFLFDMLVLGTQSTSRIPRHFRWCRHFAHSSSIFCSAIFHSTLLAVDTFHFESMDGIVVITLHLHDQYQSALPPTLLSTLYPSLAKIYRCFYVGVYVCLHMTAGKFV